MRQSGHCAVFSLQLQRHFNVFREADIEKELEMIATGQEPAEDVGNHENKSKIKGKKEKKKKDDDR